MYPEKLGNTSVFPMNFVLCLPNILICCFSSTEEASMVLPFPCISIGVLNSYYYICKGVSSNVHSSGNTIAY